MKPTREKSGGLDQSAKLEASSEDQREKDREIEDQIRNEVAELLGIRPRDIFWAQFYDIPDHHQAIMMDLELWEWELYVQCVILIEMKQTRLANEALRAKCRKYEREATVKISSVICERMYRGNFNVLSLVSEGLKNLEMNKPFKTKTGRQRSSDRLRVLEAFYFFKRTGLFDTPSQTEVAAHLAGIGPPLRADRISKIFDELGLTSLASDARKADSDAGKRKRRKG